MTRRRHLRLLTIPLVLLVAALLLLPGLLGHWVHRETSAWFSESWPEATVRWQRGWFGSRLEAADDRTHLVLDIHHSPTSLAGPLSARGPLTLTEPQAAIDLEASLDWRFDLSVRARTEALEARGVVSVSAGPTRLDFQRERDGAVRLDLRAESLEPSREPRIRLPLEPVALSVTDDGLDPGRLDIRLDATRLGAPASSRLAVRVDGIDRQRAMAWREALVEALASAPGTARASLAGIGLASAWEQLARAGLVLHLESIDLDGAAQLTGEWRPAESGLRLAGSGELGAVEAWLVPTAALATGEPPEALRREFELQTEALAGQPGVRIDDHRFVVDWPATP